MIDNVVFSITLTELILPTSLQLKSHFVRLFAISIDNQCQGLCCVLSSFRFQFHFCSDFIILKLLSISKNLFIDAVVLIYLFQFSPVLKFFFRQSTCEGFLIRLFIHLRILFPYGRRVSYRPRSFL